VTDPSLGDKALELMACGASAQQALDVLIATAPHIAFRQLALVDASGRTASFTGAHGLGVVSAASDTDAACAGNLLANAEVPAAILTAFQTSTGKLAQRLLLGLQAGLDSGGEAGQVHSAGLLVVDRHGWPVVDLRVDWAENDPIRELQTLWKLFEPQVDSYTQRAIDPAQAPSYGVPGNV
jgi:uncharacterized Ntn-hydrolase superfamily protein